MARVSPESDGTAERRWLGVRRPLFVVATCLFVAGAVLVGLQIATHYDPQGLIRHGTADERQKAALALGELAEGTDIDRVVASLVGAVEDTDVVVRSVAADSLSGVVHEMLRRPARTPAEQRKYDQRVALTVRTLTRALADPDPTVRTSAVFGFGLLGSVLPLDLPPELIAALSDESSTVRRAAAKALHDVRLTVGVVPGLRKALESPDRDVRFTAAELLGRVGPAAEPAVPALLAILNEPFDLAEREKTHAAAWYWDPACSAARSLGQISASAQVIAGLIAMVSSDNPERRSCAAEGLGTLGPKAIDAVPALIAVYDKVLASEQHTIGQVEIASSIARIAPNSASAPRAVAILIRALESRAWTVRYGAVQALGKFGKDAAGAKPKLRDIERDDPAPSAALAAIDGTPGADRPEQKEIP